jgi:hypothetical protein
MRILNFVYNAEIKYQQHIKLRKIIDTYFWSNIDPGKTHKGKTSERGRFLLFRSFREILLQHVHLQKFNDKFISITVPSLHTGNEPNSSKLFPEFSAINCRSSPLFLCLQNVVRMPRNTCELLQQISGCINGCTAALKTMPNFPKKPHSNLSRFLCQERTVRTCTESVQYSLNTAVCPSPKSVPKYGCTY